MTFADHWQPPIMTCSTSLSPHQRENFTIAHKHTHWHKPKQWRYCTVGKPKSLEVSHSFRYIDIVWWVWCARALYFMPHTTTSTPFRLQNVCARSGWCIIQVWIFEHNQIVFLKYYDRNRIQGGVCDAGMRAKIENYTLFAFTNNSCKYLNCFIIYLLS